MIGIIITGHGNFARGLVSNLELIAGPTKDLVYVDFVQEDGINELEQKMESAFKTLSHCHSLLILTDLAGGSPFKIAVEKGWPKGNVEVIAGTNIPMVLDAIFSRNQIEDIGVLVEKLLVTGKEQIMRYTYIERKEEIVTDGI